MPGIHGNMSATKINHLYSAISAVIFTAPLRILFLTFITFSASATTNFCLDEQSSINCYKILNQVVALRTGLYDLLHKGIIELDFAIDLINKMQSSSFMDRFQEVVQGKPE